MPITSTTPMEAAIAKHRRLHAAIANAEQLVAWCAAMLADDDALDVGCGELSLRDELQVWCCPACAKEIWTNGEDSVVLFRDGSLAAWSNHDGEWAAIPADDPRVAAAEKSGAIPTRAALRQRAHRARQRALRAQRNLGAAAAAVRASLPPGAESDVLRQLAALVHECAFDSVNRRLGTFALAIANHAERNGAKDCQRLRTLASMARDCADAYRAVRAQY